MKEMIEFRIPEEHASKFLGKGVGVMVGTSVRKVDLPLTDPLVGNIGEFDKELHRAGRAFFTAWIIRRSYTQAELCGAELLYASIGTVFEPAGEECGTNYDETVACQRCGLDRVQNGELILDLRHVKKRADIVKTIAGEVIVSRQFKKAWEENKLTGATFGKVLQKSKKPTCSDEWFQLKATTTPLEIIHPTQAGTDPFLNSESDDPMRYKCEGHVLGLNLISELTVSRNSYSRADLSTTKQAFGWKQGLLMPERPIILSQKAWDCLCKAEIKGYSVEVVHVK